MVPPIAGHLINGVVGGVDLIVHLLKFLADLDEQAKERCRVLIQQMAIAEGMTEELKHQSQWEWVRAMNSIVNRAEENIKRELIYA
ncbi:TnpV protein [Acutalibacter sp. JLR.KK004]|uniref:TnpV protein n=1 Tax=Acutalibacter sp. JLR.KK004 TaxID=3112622 RepID=UPI002FF3239F